MSRPSSVGEIERALITLRRSMTRRTLQRRDDPNATPATGALFFLLDALEAGGAGVTELAEMLGIDQPRASRLATQAVDRGYARRVADPDDRRRNQIDLSAKGRRTLAAAHANRRRAVEEAIEGFSSQEAANFARLLADFTGRWAEKQ